MIWLKDFIIHIAAIVALPNYEIVIFIFCDSNTAVQWGLLLNLMMSITCSDPYGNVVYVVRQGEAGRPVV